MSPSVPSTAPSSTVPRKSPLSATAKSRMRTPNKSNLGDAAPVSQFMRRTPASRRKTPGGAPRTPLGTISKSSNIAPGALNSPGVPQTRSSRDSAPSSPGFHLTRGSPGLSDSQVSEHVSYIADTLAREPTDEDVHRQLRSAIKARHENEVLRDHIENLKNSEIDQGVAASERMKEMSSEYVSRVDGLTRDVKTEQARAEAAEQEARALAEVLRSNGVDVPTPAATSAATPVINPDDAADADVSIAGDGVSATPAAVLFVSPQSSDADLGQVLGDIHDGARTQHDLSFDFGAGAVSSDTGSDWPSVSDSAESLGSDTLRAGANEVVHSMNDIDMEITPLRGQNGGTGVHAVATPSSDAAEAAAREAMATLDHPALVDEASTLVATNVRLERERRALIERLETLMRTRPTTPSVDGRNMTASPPPAPSYPASFDVSNAVRAAAQLSEAVDRVAAASSRAAMLLDASASYSMDVINSSGDSGGSKPGQLKPGGTLNKALRRMKEHDLRVAGNIPDEDRRREARYAAEEASQAASLASMQRDLLVEALEAAAPSRLALTPPPSVFAQSPNERGSAPLNVISNPPAPSEPTASQVATARAETAEKELVHLRRQLSAAASKSNEDRVESQYKAAQSQREIERLGAELAAATTAAQTAQDIATRRQKQAAGLEAKHTRLSIELSAAMQRLRETEREARAEEKRLSLSFQINPPAPDAAVSQSPLVVVGTPTNLAPVLTHVKSGYGANGDSPIASLVRQVSATSEGLAAALAAAYAAAKGGDALDDTAELVRDLRLQLEKARAEVCEANARADAAEEKVGNVSPSSPSPSPIARKRDSIDAAALDEAADVLGMNGLGWAGDSSREMAEALAWAKKNEAAARPEASPLTAELTRVRDALGASTKEQERLGLEVERSQSEEAKASLLLEQAKLALREAEEADVERKQIFSAELEAATVRATNAETSLEMAKHAAKEWKAQQTASIKKWAEEVNARAATAEKALKEMQNSQQSVNRTTEGLVAENRELMVQAEKTANETEALELQVATLTERTEAAEKSSADAPHLRAENYDLAVKHRAGLRRLHQELTARRALEERVMGYEHATAALETTVQQLEVALKQAMEMCASAKSASVAAASERAAFEARSNSGTPTSSRQSNDASSATPDDRALAVAHETLVAAVETAERDACAAREETVRAKATAAAAELDAKNALDVAEARRADLAVLRDECATLRWKILEMEEDARVSPSPRHGGPPKEPLPSDSPFSSIKTFGLLAAEEGDFSLADGFLDLDETMALTPPVAGQKTGTHEVTSRILNLSAHDTSTIDANSTRAAAEEVSAAAEAVRAENEALELRLAEAHAEAEAATARADAAEARANELSVAMDAKVRLVEEASAALEVATFAKTAAEETARARSDDALEAKATVKALRNGQHALETAAAEASAARAAAECVAAEARNEASEARSEAMREAAAAEAAHEARRRAEALAARFAKEEVCETVDAAATSPKPPPLTFRSENSGMAMIPSSGAETAAAAALAAMSATAVPPGSPLVVPGRNSLFAETIAAYTARLRSDVATAQREIAAHREHASRMKAEIDRLASDLPSKSALKAKKPLDSVDEETNVPVVSPPGDPTKAAYYKSVAKKCYARMKSQKSAYESQITGLRQQLELAHMPSLNTTNNSFAVTPTPSRRHAQFEKECDDGSPGEN